MIFVHHCRLIQQCVEDVSVYKFNDSYLQTNLSESVWRLFGDRLPSTRWPVHSSSDQKSFPGVWGHFYAHCSTPSHCGTVRHFDFVSSGHALLDFCNLSCCATARAAGLKTQVHGCVRFYSPFNDVSLEKLRDSQRKMLQQIENTRLYGKNFEIKTLCNVILF